MTTMENAAKQRESMVFYASFHEAIQDLPEDMQAATYRTVLDYAIYGAEPESTGVARAIFRLIKPQVDANNARYRKKAEDRRKKAAGPPPAGGLPEPPPASPDGAAPPVEDRAETPTERPTAPPVEDRAERPTEPRPGGGPDDDGASIARARAAVPPPLRGTDGGAASPVAPVAPAAPPASPPPPPDDFRKRPVRDLLAECEGHADWLAMVGMKNSLTAAEALRWLRAFALHLVATGRDGETMAEFKRYFANWTASEVRQGRSPINAPPPKGADDRGRAAPPDALTAAVARKNLQALDAGDPAWGGPPGPDAPPPSGMDALRARVRRIEARDAALYGQEHADRYFELPLPGAQPLVAAWAG